jgi:hypothetical protein
MERDIRESLENILSLVSEDLRFAETKNAALLTANAAAVIGILQVNPTSHGFQLFLVVYLNALTVVCALSGVVSLISFIPRAQNPYLGMGLEPATGDNLLFFGHIQKYDPPAYLRGLYASTGHAGEEPHDLERMYAEQIVVSSRIAARKFTYFRWAIWITIGALITPPLAYLLYLVINENQRQRAVLSLKELVKASPAGRQGAPKASTVPPVSGPQPQGETSPSSPASPASH